MLGLRRPATWTVPQYIASNPSKDWLYVRAPAEMNFRGLRSKSEVLDWIRSSAADPEEQSRTQIDEVIDTRVGCVLVKAKLLYMEFAIGHLSQLLRKGDLYVRSLVNKPFPDEAEAEWRLGSQKFSIVLRDGAETRHQIHHAEATELIQHLQHEVRIAAQQIPDGHLAEVLADDHGNVYFVDIKPYPWQIHFSQLFTANAEPGATLFENTAANPTAPYVGPFDFPAAELPDSAKYICLESRALLCHFVTYSLKNGLGKLLA